MQREREKSIYRGPHRGPKMIHPPAHPSILANHFSKHLVNTTGQQATYRMNEKTRLNHITTSLQQVGTMESIAITAAIRYLVERADIHADFEEKFGYQSLQELKNIINNEWK